MKPRAPTSVAAPSHSSTSRLEIRITSGLDCRQAGAGDPAGDGKPVDVGKPHVQQDDVRLQLARRAQRVGAVGGLAHDLVALVLEQPSRAGPEAGVVVDDQHGRRHGQTIVYHHAAEANTGTRTRVHGKTALSPSAGSTILEVRRKRTPGWSGTDQGDSR